MTRPVRILYILNSPGGGATQGIVELLRGLSADNFVAYLVSPRQLSEQQRGKLLPLVRDLRVVPLVWWNKKTSLPILWRLPLWGREMTHSVFHLRPVRTLAHLIKQWQIDLVHTGTALTLEGALAARLCGVPHIWHVKEWIGQHGRVRFPLPDPLLVRFFATLSRRILVMSHFIGEIFVRQGLGDKMEVVRDGVDVARFGSAANGRVLRRRLGVNDNEILVGMAASLSTTWKQHDVFIRMAARLQAQFPHVRFAMFGPEPQKQRNPLYNHNWHYYQGLRLQAAQVGLSERLIWAGFIDDIPQMMAAIDVLVHPCAIEPFGRVAIEAMAASRPVVGPNIGGISESVIDGETGFLVTPGDADAFADATSRLINDVNLRTKLGIAGRERASRHFSLAQHVQHMQSIYSIICPPAGIIGQRELLTGRHT